MVHGSHEDFLAGWAFQVTTTCCGFADLLFLFAWFWRMVLLRTGVWVPAYRDHGIMGQQARKTT